MTQPPYDLPQPHDPYAQQPYAQQPYAQQPYAVQPYAAQPPQGVAPYAPDGLRYGVVYPEASQATVALVLGIVGIVAFQLAAPFAWWLGARERSAIDAGRRDPANRGQAVAGWVLGIVGTALMALAILIVIGYFAAIALTIMGVVATST